MGQLTHEHGLYRFSYLQGVLDAREQAGFEPILSFPQFDYSYVSSDLFPFFANRLLRPSRPEYKDFIQWLNIPEHQDNPIALLARSGGKRKTDNFEVFPAQSKRPTATTTSISSPTVCAISQRPNSSMSKPCRPTRHCG